MNPTAGRGAGRAAGERVLSVLRRAGLQVVDVSARDLEGAQRAAREQVDGFDALVVVGGDGLVHAGVGAVAGTSTALGIVAAGTGNDIARGLRLPLGDPVRAAQHVADAVLTGSTRAVDAVRVTTGGTGTAGGGWYASILASGVDALVNERANRWRWPRGPARYTLAALRELAVVRGVRLRVGLDGLTLEREALLVAVANTGCYGGGMLMAPQADPTDGLLDVVVVDRLAPLAALRVFPTVRRGRHLQLPVVSVHRARTVRLEALPGGAVPRPHADGEPLGELPITCEAVPGALRVLAPPAAG
ncbi:diacylglycerol kinase family protein [Kineococcus sp. SYSU DK006]|uniref:diacylglycerol kinase family protein n=1 Tax=Kineococcus sp. SYSU DK006 TaxID=3383127 RepID=UPI003D7D890A